MANTDTIARLEKLILRAERGLQARLLKAIARARSAQSLRELSRLIEAGRFQEAADRAGMSIARNIAASYALIYVLAGNSGAEFISGAVGEEVLFNQVAPRAVNDILTERLRIISNFSGQQSDAIRSAIIDGMNRRLTPIAIARNFRDTIGMNDQTQKTVQNYRRLLESGSREALQRTLRDHRFDPKIRTSIETGEPLSQKSINMMVQRYGERLIKNRAETIAETEVLRSVNQANHEAFEQAIEDGVLERDQLVRMWVTRGDVLVRDSHAILNGEKRAVDEDFKPGLRFPGDPRAPASETIRCRCRIRTEIKQKSSDRLRITTSLVA